MNDPVQQIKDRLSIVDVVSSYLKLEKAGKNFKAKSPFSNEKTPSFYVSPERGMYYCFSTNQGGDIFTFVQKLEGVDFKGALKILADRSGVKLTPQSKKDSDERSRLYSLLEYATRHFEEGLKNESEAKKYLKGRGMTEKTIDAWRIGYADSGWDTTYLHLKEHGFTEREMELAGLIKKSEKGKGFYDRFRGRIMFPIADTSGRIIGYTGRVLPLKTNPEFNQDAAKYINSPETPLYSKSHVLFGYDKAKNTIRKFNCSILVEGQMDVILSHQAGYTNTVAVSGTALTPDQLGLLARLSKNLVMAFDADAAGVNSAGKGIMLALARGMDVKVVALPKNADPADLIKSSVSLWKEAVRSARPVIEFYLDYLAREHKDDARKLRLRVGEIVLPFLAQIPNKIDQAHFVALIAERLGIQEEPIWDELKRFRREASSTEKGPVTITKHEVLLKPQHIEQRLSAILWWQKHLPKDEQMLDVLPFEKKLESVMGRENLSSLLNKVGSEENKVLFEVEMLYDGAHTLQRDVNELLHRLERESLKLAYHRALEGLRAAESEGNRKAVVYWMAQCRELSNKLGKEEGVS